MSSGEEDILQIRGLVVHNYVLLEPDGGVILLDGGFLGNAIGRIDKTLKNHNRSLKDDVRAILLTHGHIDHTLNIAALKRATEAPVFAPKADAAHISGTYSYRGLPKVCGLMESFARAILKFEPPEIDEWYEPGETLDFWGGLKVIALPGHTSGHCGFFSEKRNALFTADSFANFYHRAKMPPPWFNVDGREARRSIVKAAAVCDDETRVFPNHCHSGGPDAHRLDLIKLAAKLSK
ncbi:MAG: MBL fold metallo-hydrolase [Verrucomicrobiales bacterium]